MTLVFEPAAEDPRPIAQAQTGVLERSHSREDWDNQWYGPARFKYQMVRSYEEAVAALVEQGAGAKILAGGQSLVPMMNLRLACPTALIDLNGVVSARAMVEGDHLVLSAMCRYSSVLCSPFVRTLSPLLAEAVTHVGNVRVRNRGTLGGSLAHGQATAELGAVVLALGGEIVALGPHGSRVICARDFFLGRLRTSLRSDEVVTALRLPLGSQRRGWAFKEMTRRRGNPAIVGVAVSLELAPGNDVIASVGVGLIGVADRPICAAETVVSSLAGQSPTAEVLETAAAEVAEATSPGSDVHASGEYRRRLTRVLTRRALSEALISAGGRVIGA
jgi:CO/xanthine dehydrogenase FAD-binding subunit